MKIRANRTTERAGVNAARAIFEANGVVFQEVDLGNDYGKDAYVDLGDGQNVSGFCIGLQIKSGTSFKRPGGYGIPLDEAHAKIWRTSTLPIAGLVHDPDDGLVRWCNISEYLQQNRGKTASYIPVPAANVL